MGEKGVMRVAGRKEGTFKRKCRVEVLMKGQRGEEERREDKTRGRAGGVEGVEGGRFSSRKGH